MADSIKDDPETGGYNVQEMVDTFVQKAMEWQNFVGGALLTRSKGRTTRFPANISSTTMPATSILKTSMALNRDYCSSRIL